MVEAGKIKNYGISTYSSLRVKSTQAKMHLNLQKVARVAENLAGPDKANHFNYVQAPCNILMPELYVEATQMVEDADGVGKNKILAAACSDLELNLMLSQPLLQGMVANTPLSRIAVPEITNFTARHLQLMRSIPSKSIMSVVVGMKHPKHVKANLEVISKAPMNRQEFLDGVKPITRTEFIEDTLQM